MSDQTAFFIFLAAIIAASGVWWIASWARDFVDAQVAAALDDFDTAADQAIDAAEQITREASA